MASGEPKLGSLQSFVSHDYDASEHGSSRFPFGEVHRLGVLDVRLYNTDRHTGNILVVKCRPAGAGGLAAALEGDSVELVPIDHGLALPESLEAVYFEWLHWPQASMPFQRETLDYIAALDGDADAALLEKELPDLPRASTRLLQLTTAVLQRAAAAGLCLADIGALLSRPLVGIGEEASELEKIVNAALRSLSLAAAAPQQLSCSVAMSEAESSPESPTTPPTPLGALPSFPKAPSGENRPQGQLRRAQPVAVPSLRRDLFFAEDELKSMSFSPAEPSAADGGPSLGSSPSVASPLPSEREARWQEEADPASPQPSREAFARSAPKFFSAPTPRPAPKRVLLPPAAISEGAPAAQDACSKAVPVPARAAETVAPLYRSFAEVPQELWAPFRAAFHAALEEAIAAHPAALARARRGSQLVTASGTRVEAFGTSCPVTCRRR